MSAGDVSVVLNNIAAGASVQLQVNSRCRVQTASNSNGVVHGAISEDNVTYYECIVAGYIMQTVTGANPVGDRLLCLPAGFYLQLTNTDTVAHDTAVITIEY